MKKTDSLQKLFSETVNKFYTNTALRRYDQTLSYQQLDHYSDIIRDILIRMLGQKPTANVAILAEHDSFFRFIYMLGILKAGMTYVPIDGAAVSARSKKILKNSKSELLLTEPHYSEFVQQVIADQILTHSQILFYTIKDLAGIDVTDAQDADTDPERSAYIVFTSGSTGEPKGVEVQDKAVINFADSVTKRLQISDSDKTLALSSFAFDASVFDIYPFLLAGAEIIMVPADKKMSISSLNQYMQDNGVTIQCMTTALYHLILSEENPVLRKLCVIGEKMMFFKDKSYQIYNMYGPTEATCLVTLTEINEETNDIPVGYPLDNIDVLILDENRNALPYGQTGEIALLGVCLARGYFNNEEETNARFVCLADGRRAYLTGDMGSLDADGNLHCFGRTDDQIKYRGYRIELAEIRNQLVAHEAVEDATVLLIEEKTGKYLAAACQGDPAADKEDVRRFLSAQLPEYMIPDRIMFFSELPLNLNHKIDRTAIREIFRKQYVSSDLPQGPVEEDDRTDPLSGRLKTIWSEILLLPEEKISPDVSFRELGGNSLQMLTMLVLINDEFKIKVPLEQLVMKPTLNNLAELIREQRS